MRKIDKNSNTLPKEYQDWLDSDEISNKNFRNVYDDIIMNLYKCQKGVCAYTEAFICPSDLYQDNNWATGEYVISDEIEFTRVDHRGELEHFDPENKKIHY